jgi:hypothetical protein
MFFFMLATVLADVCGHPQKFLRLVGTSGCIGTHQLIAEGISNSYCTLVLKLVTRNIQIDQCSLHDEGK